jgi:acyl carrier protein
MNEKLAKVFSAVLKVSAGDFTDNLSMKDTPAWDSLKHMDLIISIEDSFGVELSFEDIVSMQTVEAIKKVLTSKGIA